MGKQWKQCQTLFLGAPKSLQMVIAAMKLKDTWKESYDQPRQHIKKQRHCFANKGHLVKAMVFPVVMYGCESWTIKKAEQWRTDAFELWCWRRLLRVPWTARRFIQSILKRSPLGVLWKEWCYIWNSSPLATSCKELTHWNRLWCWEGLGAGGEGDERGWDTWMASPTRWIWVWVNSGIFWWTGRPAVLPFMGSQRVRQDYGTELNWTERNWTEFGW